MENGYIKLWRSIDRWGWRKNSNTLSVFLYCLTHARHTPGEYHGLQLQPGQLITGRDAISRGTGVTTQSVRTALNNLKKSGELTIKSTNKFSVITVVNWAKFQSTTDTPNQQPNQQLTTNQPAANQQLTTNKNENNGTMEDVVGGSISLALDDVIKRGWGKPSTPYIAREIARLANEYGAAYVSTAVDTALAHDTKGGISIAYVEKILSNMPRRTTVPKIKFEERIDEQGNPYVVVIRTPELEDPY